MAQLQEVLDNLLLQYEGYFDIEKPHNFCGEEIAAHAHYVQRLAKYVLMRSAELYAMQTHEYVFIVHRESLDHEAWELEKNRIINAEKYYVTPNSEHMYSYLTLILLCDNIEADVKKQITRLKNTKYYKHSIQGYSTVRVAAIELTSEEIFTNARGKEIAKVIEKALHM